jgi:thiol-disulfide isomerase/thioredoxin
VHANLTRRTLLAASATLLSAWDARNSARAEDVELHSVDTIVPVNPPATLPDLELHTLAGAPVELKSYFGKPLVLNFWATWCVPCVAELPQLDQLASDSSFTVLAVSADRNGAAAVTPFLAKHQMAHATILLDQGSDAVHAAGVVGFPTTLIIDAAGRVRGRLEGPATWSAGAAALRRLVS